MGTLILGRVRPLFAGIYDPTQAYEAVTVVMHGDRTYQSVIDVPAGNAPDVVGTTYWYMISQRGADGATGERGPQGPPGEGGSAFLPAGFEAWWPGTTAPPGWLDESVYHAQLPRATYPELWAMALASGNLLDETGWLAQVTAHGSCGAFSTGDGVNTFRIPLLRRVYIRARDPWTGDLQVGQYQDDAQQNITGGFSAQYPSAGGEPSGIFYVTNAWTGGWIGSGTGYAFNAKVDASRQVRTAEEVRVKTIVRLPIIKAFDTVQNPAMIEVSGLVTQLGMTNDRIAVSQQILHVQDQKAYNVSGGTFTAGAWRIRDLNTIVLNTIPGASLWNNAITLPAGTYDFDISAPAYQVNEHKIWVSALGLYGTDANSFTSGGTDNRSQIKREVTLTTQTTFSISHICRTTYATYGLGVAAGINIGSILTGINSIYTNVFIRRIS